MNDQNIIKTNSVTTCGTAKEEGESVSGILSSITEITGEIDGLSIVVRDKIAGSEPQCNPDQPIDKSSLIAWLKMIRASLVVIHNTLADANSNL